VKQTNACVSSCLRLVFRSAWRAADAEFDAVVRHIESTQRRRNDPGGMRSPGWPQANPSEGREELRSRVREPLRSADGSGTRGSCATARRQLASDREG
jgi:hypothetical protein